MEHPDFAAGHGDLSPITLPDLMRWEEYGATWKAVDVGADYAVVQLCSCTGEPVDMVIGRERAIISYVRANRGG